MYFQFPVVVRSKKCSVISENGQITLNYIELRIACLDLKTLKMYFLNFDSEHLYIFSYCTIICLYSVVVVIFFGLFTLIFAARNVRNPLKMIGLTHSVFSTKVDIHDIPVKLCLFNV